MHQAEPSANKVPEISNRYRINLILLVFLIICLTFWFYKHLHLYVTESAFIGGTLTLWGGWKLIQSWVKWGLETADKSLIQRYIGRTAATEYLVLAFIVLCVLYVTTSSVYLVYEGAKAGETEFSIVVTQNDNPYLEPVKVASYQRVAGRPFFLRFSSFGLKFNIIHPHGFEPIEKRFRPWTNIYLRVPIDFKRKDFHLIRLIPGASLLRAYPKTSIQT